MRGKEAEGWDRGRGKRRAHLASAKKVDDLLG